jgi:hypothetical protein
MNLNMVLKVRGTKAWYRVELTLLLISPELPRIPFFAETPVKNLTDAVDNYNFEPPEFIPTVVVMRSLEQDGLISLLCWRTNGPVGPESGNWR